MDKQKLKNRIRFLMGLYIFALLFYGITVFPARAELAFFIDVMNSWGINGILFDWITKIYEGFTEMATEKPFLIYGYDWLAFAHIVLALLFIGPFRDPVKNIWVIRWGMIACAGVLPLALIAGPARGLPPFWFLIDCTIGVVGIIPLIISNYYVKKLETA